MVLSKINILRKIYLNNICQNILAEKKNTVNIADVGSKASTIIANELAALLGGAKSDSPPSGQNAGKAFAEITRDFLREAFELLKQLRPGAWEFRVESPIENYEQYSHLSTLKELATNNREIAVAMGTDYLVKPDIVVVHMPIPENMLTDVTDEYNKDTEEIARYTPLREKNAREQGVVVPILHASVSCKWTIRSDRSQNTRTEALNLIRNRKGNTPHITAVTAEPLPTRIASLALGTGDMDCVYHMALPELVKAVEIYNSKSEDKEQLKTLMLLIDGKRLRDISDLAFDLAI